MTAAADDPVLRRRARLARLAETGQRVGYGFLLLAVVGFFVGLLVGGYAVWGPVVVIALAACTVTLAPAIVLWYAVKAADREDRERRASGRM